MPFSRLLVLLVLSLPSPVTATAGTAPRDIRLRPLGTYASGLFDQGGAEIVAHDPATQRLFVVNGGTQTIDVIDASNPSSLRFLFTISLAAYGSAANSVAVKNGVVAAAVEANVKTDPGKVVFFDVNGAFLSSVGVGALPDMLTFTPDGSRVLVANEGEPNDDYSVDPEGSVSIINLRRGVKSLTAADVRTARFTSFNSRRLDPSIRIYGPGATVAQDLEPEYIAVSRDGRTAKVTLQENNALGLLDIVSGRFTALKGLGFKNHKLAANALDPSDRDGAIKIKPYPVFGLYQPDAIAAFEANNQTYYITADEGDARAYSAFNEEVRVDALTLDPATVPNAAILQDNAQLGRLTVTIANGDRDGDGDYDALYVLGGRSFSILNANGERLYDSGSRLERITARAPANIFNANNDDNDSFDSRSDNKGPEPEGVTTGVVNGVTYGFVGLERIGGVVVIDLTYPSEPRFVQYINNRNFGGDAAGGTAGDLGPEGLLFIPAAESPTGVPLLVVANEVSGTTTVYEIN